MRFLLLLLLLSALHTMAQSDSTVFGYVTDLSVKNKELIKEYPELLCIEKYRTNGKQYYKKQYQIFNKHEFTLDEELSDSVRISIRGFKTDSSGVIKIIDRTNGVEHMLSYDTGDTLNTRKLFFKNDTLIKSVCITGCDDSTTYVWEGNNLITTNYSFYTLYSIERYDSNGRLIYWSPSLSSLKDSNIQYFTNVYDDVNHTMSHYNFWQGEIAEKIFTQYDENWIPIHRIYMFYEESELEVSCTVEFR